MSEHLVQQPRATALQDLSPRQRIHLAAGLMIVAHVALVGWALLQAWFYADDFQFLEEALDRSPTPSFLFTPHDSQLMPIGRGITWIVAHSGPYDWVLTAAIVLLVQTLAAVACLHMLRTLFADRWSILVPLGLFLFSPMALEAKLWWSAALNAAPMQLAFFLLVTALVRWSRERRLRWGLMSLAALALGVLSGPRGLVMIAPAGLLLMFFLTPGPWWSRPWRVVRVHAPLLVPLGVLGVAYLIAYAASTASPVAADGSSPAIAILRKLIATSWLTSAVGGPWRWDQDNPPLSSPDPPLVLHVTAVVVVITLLAVALRRRAASTTGALLMLVAQLAVTYAALVLGRGVQLGADVGLTSRYLADTLPVTTLALALATLPMAGSSIEVREIRWGRPGLVALAAGCAVFLVGSLVSTTAYASAWHDNDPARAFVTNARDSLRADPVVIADIGVPERVRTGLSNPGNLPSHFFAPLGDTVHTVLRGNDLHVLDDSGVVRQATVQASTLPKAGPDFDCGYRVGSSPVDIEIDRSTVIPFWWTSIGYLASGDGTVEIRVDGTSAEPIDVESGLHTWFFTGEGQFSTITLRALTPDLTICANPLLTGNLGSLP